MIDDGRGGVTRTGAPLRLLRSAVVTFCMMSLAVGAHVVGGGILPSTPVLISLASLALMPVAFLARRRLSFPILIGLIAGGQVLLHHSFEMLSKSPSCAPNAVHAGGTGHAGAAAQCATSTAPTSAGMPSGHFLPHFIDSGAAPLMVMGHLVAVVVMIALLARGESAIFLLMTWLRPLITVADPVPAVIDPILASYSERPIAPPARRPLPVDARRGPPSDLPRIVAAY